MIYLPIGTGCPRTTLNLFLENETMARMTPPAENETAGLYLDDDYGKFTCKIYFDRIMIESSASIHLDFSGRENREDGKWGYLDYFACWAIDTPKSEMQADYYAELDKQRGIDDEQNRYPADNAFDSFLLILKAAAMALGID